MIFNALLSAVTTKNATDKKSVEGSMRKKYITQKYNERSITNRYFK